jgi:transposase
MSKLTAHPHLTEEEIDEKYKQSKTVLESKRWRVILLCSQGLSSLQIAPLVDYTHLWVREIIHRYNKNGPDGITDNRSENGGHNKLLTPEQSEELYTLIATGKEAPGGGIWTGPKVSEWIRQKLGKEKIPYKRGWIYLTQMGFSLQKPRPTNAKADKTKQEAFKKTYHYELKK